MLLQKGLSSGVFVFVVLIKKKKSLASGRPLNLSLFLPPEFGTCFSWFKSLGVCNVSFEVAAA